MRTERGVSRRAPTRSRDPTNGDMVLDELALGQFDGEHALIYFSV